MKSDVQAEVTEKETRLRALMGARGLDALLLRRVSSFAWATAGAPSYVSTAVEAGEAFLLYAPGRRVLITNDIEAPRLERELGLGEQGWEIVASPWHAPISALASLVSGMRLGADGSFPGAPDLSAEIARMRADLTPPEVERFRALGADCAEAMGAAAFGVRPGQSEHAIAAAIGGALLERGIAPIVLQVATDERALAYRHVLPTGRRLERYAMLSFCGRREGLVCSVSRLVHVGPPPEELRRRHAAAAAVDAALLAATRPGARLADLLALAARRYAEEGFPDEWRLHHQGGPAGYEPREYLATPASEDVVRAGQVFAWNPSVRGTKSEDTALVGETGVSVLTATPGWPSVEVGAEGKPFQRPAILELG